MALVGARPAAESLSFVRTYEPNETATYSVAASGAAIYIRFASKVDSLIRETAKKAAPGEKPQLTLTRLSSKAEAEGPLRISDEKPPDLVWSAGPNNMPEDGGPYLMLFLAGMTADRAVRVDEVFPVAWRSKDGTNEVKGTGKLLALDADAKTATVAWTLKLTNRPAGPYRPTVGIQVNISNLALRSVYDIGNCSLIRCEGTADVICRASSRPSHRYHSGISIKRE